eukprot:IDg18360t1
MRRYGRHTTPRASRTHANADAPQACNKVLAELGHGAIATADYGSLAGGGNTLLLERALRRASGVAPTPDTVASAVARKCAIDDERGIEHKHPFSGAKDVLTELAADGRKLAVLSNKAQHLVRASVAHCFADVPFVVVNGARDDVPLKPSAEPALQILSEFMPGLEPDEVAFVGDTPVDVRTAIAAGMLPIACTWGFRSEADLREAGATAIARDRPDIVSLIRAHSAK